MSITKIYKQSPPNYDTFGYYSHLADDSPSKDFIKKHAVVYLAELKPDYGSPNLFTKNTRKDDKDFSNQDKLSLIYTGLAVFVFVVTTALILQIYLDRTYAFTNGVLASDHELCTEVGEKVLYDGGSSVDAAIAAVLCLCVVHPHASGVGGGGVMLVHDVRKNKTKVINFQGAAPSSFRAEMLQNVSELKQGLLVGVPGMLMGLHQAHRLYGSLSWEDVVSRAADVARGGFKVSHSLSDAVSKVRGEKLSQRFRDMFTPHGQILSPGSFVRFPALAGVLETGLSDLYGGNLSQEIVEEVRANGGVLSREDFSNYRAEVQIPLEGKFKEFIIQVPSPPSAGAALISVLKLLEDFHLIENNATENETHQLNAEALRAAAAAVLGGNLSNSSVMELLAYILRASHADVLQWRMNSSHTSEHDPSHHHHLHLHQPPQAEQIGGQVVVMGSDNLVVAAASSLSRAFGSRIVTRSGIVLNSLLLDFPPVGEVRGQVQKVQNNSFDMEKRPELFILPAIIIPASRNCGARTAISSSGGQRHVKVTTQMLNTALLLHKEKNESLFINRLQLLPKSRNWL